MIYAATLVPVGVIAKALIRLTRSKLELNPRLLWIHRDNRGRRYILLSGARAKFSDVPAAVVDNDLLGYKPSPELGFFFKTHLNVELFIMPVGSSARLMVWYDVAVHVPANVLRTHYLGLFRNAGVELEEVDTGID